MAKAKKAQKIKGVSSKTVRGTAYWYAWIDGKKMSFGKGTEGRQDAEEAKLHEQARKATARRTGAGIKEDRTYDFRTFKDMHRWYMLMPDVIKQKRYADKVRHVAHLVEYFGNSRTLDKF